MMFISQKFSIFKACMVTILYVPATLQLLVEDYSCFVFYQTCPLLLRVFCNTGRHHNILDYSRGNVPANELQIYTW
jgi:hypothetical protein